MLALAGQARCWEPKRLRLRLFSAAGRLARGGRRLRLRLAQCWPWAGEITARRRDSRAASYGQHPKSPPAEPLRPLRQAR